MRDTLFRRATVVGAMPRILAYRNRIAPPNMSGCVSVAVLGPDWIFRLQDPAAKRKLFVSPVAITWSLILSSGEGPTFACRGET